MCVAPPIVVGAWSVVMLLCQPVLLLCSSGHCSLYRVLNKVAASIQNILFRNDHCFTYTGEIDYTVDPSPNQGILDENTSESCFTVTTLSDTIVEGREDISIQFMFNDQFGSFIPADGGNVAIIEIIDDDCKLNHFYVVSIYVDEHVISICISVGDNCLFYVHFYFLVFQLGFEQSKYEVGEGDGLINDTVYIVKLNENILQIHYNLTIHVLHSEGPYPAVLGEF